MTSKVWFASLRARSPEDSTEAKVRKLFDAAGLSSCIHKQDRTAIKLHFGEKGTIPISARSLSGRSWRRQRLQEPCRL